jgi:hypothetical protein
MNVYVLQHKEYNDVAPTSVVAVTKTVAAAKRLAGNSHPSLKLHWIKDRPRIWNLRAAKRGRPAKSSKSAGTGRERPASLALRRDDARRL